MIITRQSIADRCRKSRVRTQDGQVPDYMNNIKIFSWKEKGHLSTGRWWILPVVQNRFDVIKWHLLTTNYSFWSSMKSFWSHIFRSNITSRTLISTEMSPIFRYVINIRMCHQPHQILKIIKIMISERQ